MVASMDEILEKQNQDVEFKSKLLKENVTPVVAL